MRLCRELEAKAKPLESPSAAREGGLELETALPFWPLTGTMPTVSYHLEVSPRAEIAESKAWEPWVWINLCRPALSPYPEETAHCTPSSPRFCTNRRSGGGPLARALCKLSSLVRGSRSP